MVIGMIRKCKICDKTFETKSSTRIYCYECSGNSTRNDNETRKHQKNNIKKKHEVTSNKDVGRKMLYLWL